MYKDCVMKHSLFAVAVAAALLLTGCASAPKSGTDSFAASYEPLYIPQHTMADISWKQPAVLPTGYDIDMYAGASEEVQSQIAEIDRLIAQGKFQTAWTTPCTGDYGLAKRIELAHQYFAFTMMHQMFAFKDLEPGETLYDLRSEYTGDFNMTMWDPESIVEEYIAENGESAILHMALAWYYCSVRMWYDDQWIMTPEELAQTAIDNYQKAVDLGLELDAYQTSIWGECYMVLKDSARAIPLLKKSLAMEDNTDVHYNLAMCYWNDDNWEDYLELAIAESVYSAQMYDYIPYKLDALSMLIDMCFEADAFDLADAAADVILTVGSEDVDALFQAVNWYLYRDAVDAGIEAASAILAMYPEEPAVLDDVAECFAKGGLFEEYYRFLEANLVRYPGNNVALGNLHFYYGVYWENMEKHNKAVAEVKIARDCFRQAGVYQGDMKKSLDSFINGK